MSEWQCTPECPLWRVSCGPWAAKATGVYGVSIESLEAKLAVAERYDFLHKLADLYRATIAARRAEEGP